MNRSILCLLAFWNDEYLECILNGPLPKSNRYLEILNPKDEKWKPINSQKKSQDNYYQSFWELGEMSDMLESTLYNIT